MNAAPATIGHPEDVVIAANYGGKGVYDLVEVDGEMVLRGRRSGTYYSLCGWCDGVGYRAGYDHVDGARCWHCAGHYRDGSPNGVGRAYKSRKTLATSIKVRRANAARRAAERAEQAEQDRQRFEAERVVKSAEWRAANADLATWCDAVGADADGLDPMLRTVVDAVIGVGFVDGEDTRFLAQHVARVHAAARRAETSAWVGQPGERLTLTVTVEKIIQVADRYAYYADATKPMVIMRTAEGATLIWFGQWGAKVWDHRNNDGMPLLAEGATLTVKATVGKHEISRNDYDKGAKQTTVLRLNLAK